MRQKRQPIRLIALLVTLLFMFLPRITQAGPLSSPLISSYNPPFAQANTWDKLQTFSAGLTVSGGNLIAPTIIGGTGTTSTLTLQSTSGVGAAGADIIFKVGNNGATEAGRILNTGFWGIGTASPNIYARLHVSGGSNTGVLVDNNKAFSSLSSGGSPMGLMRVDSNNVVGIGGFDPGNGTASATTDFLVSSGVKVRLTSTGVRIEPGGISANPTNALDLVGDFQQSGLNGQKYVQGRKTELTTIAAAATTATTITIPANAILRAVMMRVTVQPPGTATMVVTATTSGTVLQQGASMSTAINTTDVGTRAWGTNYVGVAAQTITITPNATPSDATGRVRFDIYYDEPTAPTS